MSYESACFDPTCGSKVCLTDAEHRYHKERGTVFYCASGHGQVFGASENDELRKKVATLEKQLAVLRSEYERAINTYFCPFAKCFVSYKRKSALASHLAREHGARSTPARKLRALPQNAGPTAYGSGV